MDVFSRFLVTLDYPMRKLLLAPLPPRPNETSGLKPTLETRGNTNEDESPDNTRPRLPHLRPSRPRMALTTAISPPR